MYHGGINSSMVILDDGILIMTFWGKHLYTLEHNVSYSGDKSSFAYPLASNPLFSCSESVLIL
jgi:hypothetical protein